MKKQDAALKVPEKSDGVSDLNATAYARQISIDLTAPVDGLWQQVVKQEEASKRHFAAHGLLLLTIRKTVAHGLFLPELERRGIDPRQAQRAMAYAQFVFSRPVGEQDRLLEMPRTKVCALAAADPEVVEAVMEEGLDKVGELSSRDLARALSNTRVELMTAIAERDGAIKQLKKRSQRDDDMGVPVVIADIRAEMASLVKKAELAITSMHPVGVEAVGLGGHAEAGEWVKPTLRLGLSGLLAVRELIDGSIKSYAEAMGEQAQRLATQPDALAFLDESEVHGVAEDWARLTALHSHEEALRKHERDQAKPKGKGRPAKAPEARF